jgi:magnesium-transporting ATPase (P-type)
MISTSRLKFVVSNHDIVLRSLRGGEIAIAAQNDVVSSIKENDNKVSAPPTPECRIQLKTDPSNIPLNTLLSNTYLSVPNANNGRTLFGLTLNERYHRLTYIYGQNELDQPPHRSLGSYIIEQFQDKLVRILLIVALISGLFGLLELKDEIINWASPLLHILLLRHKSKEEGTTSIEATNGKEDAASIAMNGQFSMGHIIEALVEPIVISTILVLNALVGGYQSLNASKGISALKQMQAQKAVIKINSGDVVATDNLSISSSAAVVEEVEVESSTLVPGDVVILTVGQKIPADIRLVSISTSTFTVDEACLTGESDSVTKEPYRGDDDSSIDTGTKEGVGYGSSMGANAKGMLYGGTVITAGKGVGVVVRTGMDTAMGKVRLHDYWMIPSLLRIYINCTEHCGFS